MVITAGFEAPDNNPRTLCPDLFRQAGAADRGRFYRRPQDEGHDRYAGAERRSGSGTDNKLV